MAKTQDYKLGEFTFPRGWFMVAEAAAITAKPHSARFFGQDVVLYRGASGRAVMLDAYCPHMKTHLGKNETSYIVKDGRHVEGDSIRCPYHGWRFGPDGRCNEIPYFDGPIPAAARIRSWTIAERYGVVFCWHDPEGQEPDFDLPAYPEWDDPQWIRWRFDDLGTMATHPQEILDNMADVAHLPILHGAAVEYFENEVEGPILHQRQGGHALRERGVDFAWLVEKGMATRTRYTGPGLLTCRYDYQRQAAQLIAHTPVDDGVVRVWHGVMVQALKPGIDESERALAARMCEMLKIGFMDDFEVWSNKEPAVQIMQVPTDGPFKSSRAWYSQFYNPRARAAEILARAQGMHYVPGHPPAPKEAAE